VGQTPQELIGLARDYGRRWARSYASLTSVEQERFWADFDSKLGPVEWEVEVRDVVPNRHHDPILGNWGDPIGYTLFGLIARRGNWFIGRSEWTVQVGLPISAHEQVANLKKGQRVYIAGVPSFNYRGGNLDGSFHFVIPNGAVRTTRDV